MLNLGQAKPNCKYHYLIEGLRYMVVAVEAHLNIVFCYYIRIEIVPTI